jgi:hypothetical protein
MKRRNQRYRLNIRFAKLPRISRPHLGQESAFRETDSPQSGHETSLLIGGASGGMGPAPGRTGPAADVDGALTPNYEERPS